MMVFFMKSIPLAGTGYVCYRCAPFEFYKSRAEMHLTQGAISQQIRQLEERLGLTLFIRYHRRLELTVAGARLAVQLKS